MPLDLYERFREPLRTHQTQAVGDIEAQSQDLGNFDLEKAITTYQQLITELPQLNRQLLLYILDLLAVFASKSDINLMTSANLAAIFQPGLLSHPDHDMKPQEYRLCQDILIFLVDNQDSFLIGMSGTAADEKTVREVQSGASTRQPNTPTIARSTHAGLGRSASNASAGADSMRNLGGLRRNASVSSKNSKLSANVPSPVTPSSGTAFASNNTNSGVYRSNTVPSKKSPGLTSGRFNVGLDSPTSPPIPLSPGGPLSRTDRTSSPGSKVASPPTEIAVTSVPSSIAPKAESSLPVTLAPAGHVTPREQSKERFLPTDDPAMLSATAESAHRPGPSPMGQKMSSIFAKSPTSDGERREGRPPNKLKKKRIPSSTHPSAHSSTNSLHAQDSPTNAMFHTPMPTSAFKAQTSGDPFVMPEVSHTVATPQSETGPTVGDGARDDVVGPPRPVQQPSESTLKPSKSPPTSVNSKSSITDQSDLDHNGNGTVKEDKSEKKRRWRFSSSAKKNGQVPILSSNSPTQLGSNAIAETSTSSVGSWNKAVKSMSDDSLQPIAEPSDTGLQSSTAQQQGSTGEAPGSKYKDVGQDSSEKKGPIGWFKAKRAQAKEEKKEREAGKERAKSPPSNGGEHGGSKNSLPHAAYDGVPTRGRLAEERSDDAVELATESDAANADLAPNTGKWS